MASISGFSYNEDENQENPIEAAKKVKFEDPGQPSSGRPIDDLMRWATDNRTEMSPSEQEIPIGGGAFEEEILEEARPTVTKNISKQIVDKRSTRAIQEQEKKVLAKQQELMQQNADIQVQANEASQPIMDEANAEMNKLNEQKMARQQAFNEELQKDLEQLEMSRASLAKMQPKSFWANKDTEDKLMIGLASVFAGMGSALAGSKGNAGVEALRRVIDRDIATKEKHFDRQLELLDRRKMNLAEKAKIQSKMILEYESHVAHSKDLLKQKLDRVALTAKSESVKNLAAQESAKLEAELLEDQRNTEAQLANRTNEKMSILLDAETMQPVSEDTGGMSANDAYATMASRSSSPKPLNEIQGKSKAWIMRNKEYAKYAEKVEKSMTPQELERLRGTIQRMQSSTAWKEIPIMGRNVEAIESMLSLDDENAFERALPGKGGRYYRAIMSMAFNQARYVSGAKIDANDVKQEILHAMPSVTTKYEDLHSPIGPAANRRSLFKAHQVMTGGKEPLYFQRVRKRKRKKK